MEVIAEGPRGEGLQGLGAALISVSPVAGGWCVSSPIEESLMFLTGDHAEHQARTLGRCLASLGRTAVVEVLNREGAVAGSVTYPAGERGEGS
jgi:hypothetical protein